MIERIFSDEYEFNETDTVFIANDENPELPMYAVTRPGESICIRTYPKLSKKLKIHNEKWQTEKHMKKLYPTSEKHFIRVVYEHFMRLLDNPTMEDKEKIARVALDLHKQYFNCCMSDIEVADKD